MAVRLPKNVANILSYTNQLMNTPAQHQADAHAFKYGSDAHQSHVHRLTRHNISFPLSAE